MQISSDEAMNALAEVDRTEARNREARTYWIGSPHLILWGLIWVVAYTATGLWPGKAGLIWGLAWIPGAVGGAVMGNRHRWPKGSHGKRLGLIAIAILFLVSTYAIMEPHSGEQLGAYPPIVVAAAYSVAGVLVARRYLVIGGALLVLTLVGYFFLKPWLAFWLAAVGGGGLILGGLWFRKA